MDRAEIAKHLTERFRYRPPFLTPEKVVQLIRRLIKHARPGYGRCILWGGARKKNGYGLINVRLFGEHHQLLVHRLAYQLAKNPGDIPRWREIAHGCDTPPCFNPDCLESQRRLVNRRRSAQNTNAKKAARAAAELTERA